MKKKGGKISHLVLVRHGESIWNAKGLWTGWTDVGLTPKGKKEAQKAARHLKDIDFHLAFTSDLKRARQTLDLILATLNKQHIPTHISSAIRERHYGEFTGKNKWEIQKKLGDEKFTRIRRAWNEPIHLGESLKHVFDRVLAHYHAYVKPALKEGKNILFVAHGNSNRALIKHLEGIPDHQISEVEIKTGEVIIYKVNKDGKVIYKEKRTI